MTLFSCQDARSRKSQNKDQYPPEKLFGGAQLQAAQKIFDEDQSGLENVLKADPKLINKLSNTKGYTLLMYASIVENLDAMEILLKNGADPNLVIPHLYDLPLSHAVATNNYEMAKLLFKYNSNPNPAVGSSPLCDAMMLGTEGTEKKMIQFLIENGADINHTSYLGKNIMEAAARSNLKTAEYLLEKGGKPKIEGTELSPIASYIDSEEKKQARNQNSKNAPYFEKLSEIKKKLQEKYGINFPVEKNEKEEARLRIILYEKLNDRDKASVNFNKNYGENRYNKDQKILSQ